MNYDNSSNRSCQEFLFTHFATLVTAPDGIPRLRELILQLAVQGKLGTQDAGDEPASVLLNRIKKEKEKFVKESKIRPIKTPAPLSDIDTSITIPNGWMWTRFGNLIELISGLHILTGDYNETGKGIPYITGPIDFREKYPVITKWSENPKAIACEGDILITVKGAGLGKNNIVNCDQIAISRQLMAIRGINVNRDYLHIFIRSKYDYFQAQGVGIAIPGIGRDDILDIPIPLPPLAEQHRIVAKVDRLMALCDELESRQQQERAGCLRLGIASLTALQNVGSPEEFERQWAQVCEAFDLIFDCPENVATLRQTILQMAVQGRLVRQHPGDEPADKLLERIRKEKERLIAAGTSKREKNFERLDGSSYRLPHGWRLCQLGEISEILMGNSPPGDTYNTHHEGVPLINGPTEFSKDPLGKAIIAQYTTQPTKFCKENDLLICVRGATTGRTNIAGFDACIGRGVAAIRAPAIQSYLNLFILTKAQQILAMGTGSTFPSISQNDLLTIPVPLPPLAEQHRIVARVNALMALCDELESRLKERSTVQGRLAEAVMKGVEEGVL